MVRSLIIFFLACCSLPSLTVAQTDTVGGNASTFGLSAGIGVDLVRAADIIDYANSISISGNRIDDFSVAAEFFGAAEIRINDSWGMKFEYAYLVNSTKILPQPGFPNKINYNIHMPTVLAQYLLPGKGYVFKFGGGLGYHVANVNIPNPAFVSQSKDYSSKGVGLKLEAEANTEFDQHFFGVITADIRNEFMSEIKDSNDQPLVSNNGKQPRMNFFSLGLKFGFIYYF